MVRGIGIAAGAGDDPVVLGRSDLDHLAARLDLLS